MHLCSPPSWYVTCVPSNGRRTRAKGTDALGPACCGKSRTRPCVPGGRVLAFAGERSPHAPEPACVQQPVPYMGAFDPFCYHVLPGPRTRLSGESCPAGFGIYIVMPGDTCYNIATWNGISVAELKAANPGLDCGALQLYQALCVPSGPAPGPAPAPEGEGPGPPGACGPCLCADGCQGREGRATCGLGSSVADAHGRVRWGTQGKRQVVH